MPQMNTPGPQPVAASAEVRGEVFAAAENELRFESFNEGSLVKMFPGSRLQFDFSESERRIYLLRGEAEFTVAKDSRRPFIVQTESVEAKAVGTIYSVRAGSTCRVVKVREGIVEVSIRGVASASVMTLPAGKQFNLSQGCPKPLDPKPNSATTGK